MEIKETYRLYKVGGDIFEGARIDLDGVKCIEFLPPEQSEVLTDAKGTVAIARLDKQMLEEFGHTSEIGRRREKRQRRKELRAQRQKERQKERDERQNGRQEAKDERVEAKAAKGKKAVKKK